MASLNVLIDGRALVGERTGIGVHTAEIAKRLHFDLPPLIASHAPISNVEGIEHCRFRADRWPLGVLWQQFKLPTIDADVLWGPHTTLPVTLKIPAVVSLHDFTSITMPARHRLRTILSFNVFVARSLEAATCIAAVSRRVADEAMRSFAVPAGKIEIVPNGVDEFFCRAPREEGDYILYVGTLEPRKGLDDLVSVWSTLPEPRPRLVLCGSSGWGRRAAVPGVEVTGFVPREKLRELYRGAKIFVYPSHEEGFGIPPLEAMACGAPVIATATGAVPEYGAGVVELVEPADRDALRAAMVRLLRDPDLRHELRTRGAARAQSYRWGASAVRMGELLAGAAR